MVSTEQFLERGALSRTYDRIKPVRTFLRRLMISQEDVLHTETVELSSYEGEAEIAPFVKKNGASIMVGGDSEKFATIECPNIRISRPIEPSRLLTERRPGEQIFVGADEVLSSGERYIARQLRRLRERIDNSEEYMVSQLMQGGISYQVSEQANFQITLPRDSANNIDLVTAKEWDNADQTGVFIYEDFDLAKSLASEAEGAQITHAIMGNNAAVYFLRNAKVQALLDKSSGILTGEMDLRRQYQADGAIYLGNFCGVECWKYPRQLNVAGTPTDLIRSSYVEFVSATPSNENTMHYGMIPDMDAFASRELIGKVYTKTWTNPDPSHLRLLAHSRPLPWFPRANSNVSMKVLNA